MKKFSILLLLFISHLVIAQSPNELFTKANEAYADANYKEATRLYKKILQKDLESSELHFNLGNAYHKQGKVAPSIYHYEMALLLSPGNKTYQNNLKFAQQKTIDEVKSPTKSKFDLQIQSLINWFNLSQWARITIGFALFSLICFAGFLFLRKIIVKRILFTFFIFGILLCISTYYVANKQVYYNNEFTYAIVFTEETKTFSEPNETANVLFTLHEGTKVKVEDEFRNYTKIRLANNVTGWIETSDLKKIKLD